MVAECEEYVCVCYVWAFSNHIICFFITELLGSIMHELDEMKTFYVCDLIVYLDNDEYLN